MITPTVFRAAGERILLCQLDTADVATNSADELGDGLARLYHEGVDGIVFTDSEGVIRAANEAFLNLTDSPNMATVRGKSLADFLARGAVDLRVMLDNVKRTGQLRLYATRLNTDYSGQIAAEISATWLGDLANPIMAMVVRDASRIEVPRKAAVAGPDEGVRNVMELVGSSTLRDIVAETTDVIEKMCIETALELTRNNRVACTDMALAQLLVIALLLVWGRPWHALAITACLIAQFAAMRVLLRDPKAKAPWYNGTGVLLYVTGMMIAAFAVRTLGAH